MGDIIFPHQFQFLFEPWRYKVAYGGRGGLKSWSFAQAILIIGSRKKIRVLCTREVQKSIKDSVHKLLSDQIMRLGLSDQYDVLDTVIRGKNGTEILFAGLSTQTSASIKSYEGIDICWCEEAQTISKKSWDILVPTIRAENSEIWVSFNPDLDTDETYVRFIQNKPDNAFVLFTNWDSNPWFPDVLEDERIHCQKADPDGYENIWEGKCKAAVEGAIYAKELSLAQTERRITNLPHDPNLKVHCVWDLGWNDAMVIGFVQVLRSEIRIIDYLEDSHQTIDWYLSKVKERGYNWGYDFLPHDARHKDFKTGKSTQQICRAAGRNVYITPSVSVEVGIKSTRRILGQCYFDERKTKRLVECLKRYRRSVNSVTNEPGAPVHDEFSHGADMLRYLALNVHRMNNETENDYIPYAEPYQPAVVGMGM